MSSHEKDADYSVVYMLPPALEDWVDQDHPVRFIRDLVECMDLKQMGFKMRKSREGAPSFAPSLLLKIWLYGWFERLRSTRKLEWACYNLLPMIWLTGQHYPDHNTLWRFWRDNKHLIKEVFRTSIQVAIKAQLVGMVLHAIDGTKLVTLSARRSSLHKDDLQKLLAKLEEQIELFEGELEAAAKGEKTSANERLPEQLTDAKQRKQLIKQQLEELNQAGLERMQPSEPEANMIKSHGKNEWAWNAQAVVDQDSRLIVAADLNNKASDAHQLVPMLEQTKSSLGSSAEVTVADTGYSQSSQELADAHDKGHEVVASRKRQEQQAFHTSQFHFDPQADTCTCPKGKPLTRNGHRGDKRRFQCPSFEQCPFRQQCCKGKKGREVEFGPHNELIEQHRRKLLEPVNRARLKTRSQLVEPVFGSIKHNDGFRRMSVRGMASSGAQWQLMCLTWNLRILARAWRKGKLALE
jgi:transposase